MTADVTSPKEIFNYFLKDSPTGCTWVADGVRWSVCMNCVLRSPARMQHLDITSLSKKKVPEVLKLDVTQAYPENIFKSTYSILDVTFSDILTKNDQLFNITKDSNFTLAETDDLPIRHYKITDQTILEYWKANPAEVGIGRIGNLILKFSDGKSDIYYSWRPIEVIEDIQFISNGKQYKAADWNEKEKCYKNLEENMAKEQLFKGLSLKDLSKPDTKAPDLAEELEQILEPVKEVQEEVIEDIPETPVENIVPEESNSKSESVQLADMLPEPPKEIRIIELPRETAEKKQRRKAVKTKVADLTETIEMLGGSVPEDMSAEDVLSEIRQLRDLIIAASRRSANIATTYFQQTSKAAEALEQIKGLLG